MKCLKCVNPAIKRGRLSVLTQANRPAGFPSFEDPACLVGCARPPAEVLLGGAVEEMLASDFTTWKQKDLSVSTVDLDDRNPRIGGIGHVQQRDIAAELVAHENVYQLAKEIADQGYFPTERIVAVEEDGRTIVVEGNRRVAALKMLLSPVFAPPEYQERFKRLGTMLQRSTILKVAATIAPSREAAAPLIVSRHTRTGVERWKPAQQAKYLRTFLAPNTTIEEAAAHLGIQRGELSDALRLDTMYKIAQSLDLVEETKKKVRDTRAFNATTLQRFIQSKPALDVLKVDLDEFGNLSGHIDPDEFKKTFGRIVSDIADGSINSRNANTTEQIQEYLDKLGADRPDESRTGSFTDETLLATAAGAMPAPAPPPPTPQPRPPKPPVGLVPKNVKSQLLDPRINGLLEELRRLRVTDYPTPLFWC